MDFYVKNKIINEKGVLYLASHNSVCCKSPMDFSIFIPKNIDFFTLTSAIFWIPGLLSDSEKIFHRTKIREYAYNHKTIIVGSDNSPRGKDIPDIKDSQILGQGASYYINAKRNPWSDNYRMYDYISHELPRLICKLFPFIDKNKLGIIGHSMGGHGVLSLIFKETPIYNSISVFSPICSLKKSSWGKEALSLYIGNEENWDNEDATALLLGGKYITKKHIFLDYGSNDQYLQSELFIQDFITSCIKENYPITVKIRDGYGHGHDFIDDFIDEHIYYHTVCMQHRSTMNQ